MELGGGYVCNKFETCADCPDRSIHPNCHSTCIGYKCRMEQKKKHKEEWNKQRSLRNYSHETYERVTSKRCRTELCKKLNTYRTEINLNYNK